MGVVGQAAPVVQDGKSIGLSVRATNVTRRKQAEQQLLTQARVLETMREGVVLFGPGGDIRVANPAVGRLFGQATDALLGAPVARPSCSSPRLPASCHLFLPYTG